MLFRSLWVASGTTRSAPLKVDGEFGVARVEDGAPVSYALHHGKRLQLDDQDLLHVELTSKKWAEMFDCGVTAIVSLADRRASISLPLNPIDRQLVMFPPRPDEKEEAASPITVAVSFRVNERPKRLIALRSQTKMPKLDDPAFEQMKATWSNDFHRERYLRQPLEFSWDADRRMVTVTLDVAYRQLVWE